MDCAIAVIVDNLVAGPGVEPGLGDYEPPVQPYTTPHVCRVYKFPECGS